jgi:hypothetical protein
LISIFKFLIEILELLYISMIKYIAVYSLLKWLLIHSIGDSSLLRLMADSFGMTTSFLKIGEAAAIRSCELQQLPLSHQKITCHSEQ